MRTTFLRTAGAVAAVALACGCSTGPVAGEPERPGETTPARPLSTVPPTVLGERVAELRTAGTYAHDDTTVYSLPSASDSTGVVALTIATGERRWSATFPDGGSAADRSAPVLVNANGRALIVQSYTATKPDLGTVAGYGYAAATAFDAQSGAVVWNVELRRAERNGKAPAVSLVGRDSVLAASWASAVQDKRSSAYYLASQVGAALDVSTGAVMWQRENFSPRAVDAGVVAGFSTPEAKPLALDSLNGNPLWTVDQWLFNERMNWVAPGVLFVAGLKFNTQSNQLVDSRTGAKKLDLADPKVSYDKAIDAGDGVILLYVDGRVAAYDDKTFAKLWELPDPAANRIIPNTVGAIWHGTIYGSVGGVKTQQVALEARTGREKPVNPSCLPKVLVPGYALCGDSTLLVHPFEK